MRLFGFELTRSKQFGNLPTSYVGRDGWFPVINEPHTGAWQHNISLRGESLLAYHAVYACIERIASDIAKCRIRLVQKDNDGIWSEIDSAAFAPVLRKPNGYQNRIKFYESWVVSKLIHGNTYALKRRDNRNIVVELYILDPRTTRPQVAPNGDVYYQIAADNLAELDEQKVVPASEIIHDMTTVRHHPLCGISPLIAASLPAIQGLRIQGQSASFFENRAQPSGILTAPKEIPQKTADRIKEFWSTQFQGPAAGKVAVLGDGLEWKPLTFTAIDSQLIEQLGLSAKMVCSAFGVPAYMAGAADPPSYNNIEALNQQYYSQTLQKYFEAIELLMDEGLGLTEIVGKTYGTEFDLDDLLRMDTKTLIASEKDAVGAGIKAPNEARLRLNLPPVVGGDTPYMQQQNYSLSALDERDRNDPFAKPEPAPPPVEVPPPADDDEAAAEEAAAVAQVATWAMKQELERLRR